ncbi:MAG: hypothetical protein JXA21_29515 [Anaerolineae bacterium]|nr:hypothetical protein [Anaerolineae bacterium]
MVSKRNNASGRREKPDRVPERLYLSRFKADASIRLQGDEVVPAVFDGEMLVAGELLSDRTLRVHEVRRIVLASQPLEDNYLPPDDPPNKYRQDQILYLAGPLHKNDMISEDGWEGRLKTFQMRLYYSALGEDRGCVESDAGYARLEILQGEFGWRSIPPDEGRPPQLNIEIMLQEPVRQYVGAVSGMKLTQTLSFTSLKSDEEKSLKANSLVGCNASSSSSGSDTRKLALRFFLLSKAITSPSSIEGDVQDLMMGACEVWCTKAGLNLSPDPNIVPLTLPTNGYACTDGSSARFCVPESKELDLPVDIGAVTNPGYVPDNTRIDVFLVDELDVSRGGGVARKCQTSEAFVILEIGHIKPNKYLLAHELGHVLGLRHPSQSEGTSGCNDPGLPLGSPCSVMVPDRPNSNRNTTTNFAIVDAAFPILPAVTDAGYYCNRKHDDEQGFFHIVRDFPYDDGTPHPAAADCWTYSDVWNYSEKPYYFDQDRFYANNGDEYVKGDPIFSPTYAPCHCEPTYTGPNYMYVRLHTCQALDDNDTDPVQVYLYLAVPGVSSKPLCSLLNTPLSFDGDKFPKPGGARIKYLSWNVPPGYSDCCVFAVSRTAQDPGPPQLANIVANPSAYNFYDLFSLLRSSSNVSQRNLHIQATSPTAGTCASLMFGFENIFPESAEASLEIDATQADRLKEVSLLMADKVVGGVMGRYSTRLRLSPNLAPRQRLDLSLQTSFPASLAIGTELPLNLRFFLNDELVSGYKLIIRMSSFEAASEQVVDLLYGMLKTVASVWNLRFAQELALTLTQRESPLLLQDVADAQSRELMMGLVALSGQIPEDSRVSEAHVIKQDLEALAQQFDTIITRSPSANYSQDGVRLEQVRKLAHRIQYYAGHVARYRQ